MSLISSCNVFNLPTSGIFGSLKWKEGAAFTIPFSAILFRLPSHSHETKIGLMLT